MKCAAKQVLRDRKIDEIQRTYDEMSQELLRVLDAGAGIALHSQKDVFGKIRLERFFCETLGGIWDDDEFCKAFPKEKDEYRRMFSERETDSKERGQLRDSIQTVTVRNVRQLMEIGYDFEDAENTLQHHVPDRYLPPYHRDLRERREQYLRQMEPTCRVYIARGLNHLNEYYSFGPARLHPVHVGIREHYNRYVGLWLDFRDHEADKLLAGWMKQVRGYGVEMTYWGENKPEEPKEIPAGMENLAWDKIKDNQIIAERYIKT